MNTQLALHEFEASFLLLMGMAYTEVVGSLNFAKF